CANQGSPRSALGVNRIASTSNIPNLSRDLVEIPVDNDPQTQMRVPRGFQVREVARSGASPLPGSDYHWHGEPDGGAVFATPDGGWIYVSNAEIDRWGEGGVGALRFSPEGVLVDGYSICGGTTNNCAGGPTPWGTWLSCEEIDGGLVFECDPMGARQAIARPALGTFRHEAAAVDPYHRHLYLTEDEYDGCLYRFTPASYPEDGTADLSAGRLQVATVVGSDVFATRKISWRDVPAPTALLNAASRSRGVPTRYQLSDVAHFSGGEGCWFHAGIVYFSTKGDNRIWAVDTRAGTLDIVYDRQRDRGLSPAVADVDNVTVSAGGDIVVAEDGAEMRLVVVGAGVQPWELVKVFGHHDSEITGPAFNPDGSRLYFSSQRGMAGAEMDGRTYEMRGPFFV
ncbi:MAG: alkaline phosphatase PhoX, partial [Pseudomonadota bacterium]